jgi:hypothetical protein
MDPRCAGVTPRKPLAAGSCMHTLQLSGGIPGGSQSLFQCRCKSNALRGGFNAGDSPPLPVSSPSAAHSTAPWTFGVRPYCQIEMLRCFPILYLIITVDLQYFSQSNNLVNGGLEPVCTFCRFLVCRASWIHQDSTGCYRSTKPARTA